MFEEVTLGTDQIFLRNFLIHVYLNYNVLFFILISTLYCVVNHLFSKIIIK